LFGGGGYGINPGGGNKNYWLFGLGAGRAVTVDLWLGVEAFHQSADKTSNAVTTGFNLGATYDVSKQQQLLLILGRGVQNADRTNQFTGYLGYRVTF
jgi:hypothetical protein